MYKKFLAVVTALTLMTSMTGIMSYADNADDGSSVAGDSELSDDEEAMLDNFFVTEFVDDLEEADDLVNDDGTASPDWLATPSSPFNESSTHANIVLVTKKHLSEKYTDKQIDQIMELMVFSANIADYKTFHETDDTPVSSTKRKRVQLHAVYGTNYLADLKILWKYAKLVETRSRDETEELIRDSMSKLNKTEVDDMETLFETIRDIYPAYKKEKKITRNLTGIERKYLVVGLALHLIGDIYAHASLVPTEYGDKDKTVLKKSDFKSENDYLICLNKIKAGDGVHTFRTTQFIDYVKDTTSKPYNRYYEDNTQFMNERVKLAKYTAIKFISRIETTGQTFSTNYVFRDYKTTEGDTYSVKLAKFDLYVPRV